MMNDEWWYKNIYIRINWNALRPHTNGILLILAMIFPKLVSTVPTSAHVESQTCARGEMCPAPQMWVRFSISVNLLKHWNHHHFDTFRKQHCDILWPIPLCSRAGATCCHQPSKLDLGDLHGLLGNESSYVGPHNRDHPSIQGNER